MLLYIYIYMHVYNAFGIAFENSYQNLLLRYEVEKSIPKAVWLEVNS